MVETASKQESAPKEYSREDILNDKKRESEARAIQESKKNKELDYDKKTPEGQVKLSQEWMKRAHVTPAQESKIWKTLEVAENASIEEKASAIAEWQETNGLKDPNTQKGDGILGWATLEAIDNAIEAADRKYDQDNNKTSTEEEWYGLARARYHEKKSQENSPSKNGNNGEKIAANGIREITVDTALQKGPAKNWEKYKDASGRFFTVENDENGKPIALSSDWTSLKNQYFNDGKWEPYTDKIKEERRKTFASENLKRDILATTNIKASDGNTESLQWTIDDKKTTYGETKMGELSNTIQSTSTWDAHADVRNLLTTAQENYNLLPDADKTALKDVTLSQYREMVQNPTTAVTKLAPRGKPAKLPAWFGEKWMLYQQDGSGLVLKTNEKGWVMAIVNNWKETSIIDYALASNIPSHDLPNGSRITRTTEWNTQVLNYFAKKNDTKASYSYLWGKWETVQKAA